MPSRIGITVGDIAGIGPEIALKSLLVFPREEFELIGPARQIRRAADALAIEIGETAVRDTGDIADEFLHCGRYTAETGRASHAAVEEAARAAVRGELSAIVTAPIAKKAWSLAGFDDPGHTELIGAIAIPISGGAEPVMGFVGREADGSVLRVALTTIHIPLADVPRRLSREGLLTVIRVAARDLRERFGVRRPRLGVAGLNPHAGESGRIGAEDLEVIAPAVADARQEGLEVEGPLPGDAIFTPRTRRRFDMIIAMYHDQGLAPFKALTSGSGVNVTLGLPIIRTSPDHGTAFDIAGRGIADPSSMIEAIQLARELARYGAAPA